MSAFCALAFCLVASGAWGDSISIQNASFEQVAPTNPLASPCNGPEFCAYNAGNPMPGWTIGGTNASAGQFEPSSFYFSLPVPDGSIVAYINSGSISQTLTGISLLPDSVYTLSVDVGRRFDVGAANYSLNLLDGSNVCWFVRGRSAFPAFSPYATLAKRVFVATPNGLLSGSTVPHKSGRAWSLIA